MTGEPISEKSNEENKPIDDSKVQINQGNIGFLTIKLLAEINDKLARLIPLLEVKENG